MNQPDIFDRAARRGVFNRAAGNPAEDRWLLQRMSVELLDRLDSVKQSFSSALILGFAEGSLAKGLDARGIRFVHASPGAGHSAVICDEDRLPFRDASFDLVLAIGTLDTVNDLPGALILIRRTLRPESLFMAALSGVGSLPVMRDALANHASKEVSVARFHPAIDVRSAGDLLARAGFALPVADSEPTVATFRDPKRLIADLRANGLSNVLAHRVSFDRREYRHLMDGLPRAPIRETFATLYLTGWSPAARRPE